MFFFFSFFYTLPKVCHLKTNRNVMFEKSASCWHRDSDAELTRSELLMCLAELIGGDWIMYLSLWKRPMSIQTVQSECKGYWNKFQQLQFIKTSKCKSDKQEKKTIRLHLISTLTLWVKGSKHPHMWNKKVLWKWWHETFKPSKVPAVISFLLFWRYSNDNTQNMISDNTWTHGSHFVWQQIDAVLLFVIGDFSQVTNIPEEKDARTKTYNLLSEALSL